MGKQPFWQKKFRKNSRRPPTEKELDAWLHAADAHTGPMSRDEIIRYLQAKNAHRWWRINYDIKWIKKQMIKIGLNPEDWKELL